MCRNTSVICQIYGRAFILHGDTTEAMVKEMQFQTAWAQKIFYNPVQLADFGNVLMQEVCQLPDLLIGRIG
jgi:hypothetical protein